jgi:hypothetical protein
MPESRYPISSAILAAAVFRKSTRSDNTSSCVEVANLAGEHGVVLVRDTKNRDAGVLAFAPGEWAAFVSSIKAGDLDL